jgi:polygalacturonase
MAPVSKAVAFLLPLLLAAPASSENLCPVTAPGAAGVQAAIDSCAAKGGGVAYVPPGEHVTGPIWMRDNVELRLEAGATLRMSHDKADWPRGARALVNSKGVRNIAITGRGTFDGAARWVYEPVRGQDVEIVEEQENARRAGVEMKRYYRTGDVQKYLFVLRDSEDVRIEGVTIKNAPLWNVRLQDCDRVWVRGIHLYSDLERGVNSDGIDIVSSSNVTISDSMIVTADDSICLKTEAFDSPSPGRTVRPVENVLVTNSILGSSSAPMMIGTETHADIRHVVFSNIVVRDSNKVFGINVQDGGTVSDVRFHNVTFETSRRHWNWWGSAEVMKFVLKRRTPESKLGRIEHVTVDGVQGTARGTSFVAGHAERMLEDIAVTNLRVRMLAENKPDKRATHGLVFERVKRLTLRNVQVEWDRQNPEPGWQSALVLRDVEDLVLEGFRGEAARGGVPPVARERVR